VPLLGEITSWLGATQGINWLIVGDTWKVLPVVALLTLAGLLTIPRELYEAAEVDGANAWQRFWLITLPWLRPVLLVILVYRTMELFRVFEIIYILMAYTIPVLAVATFQQAFVFGLFGKGAGIAFLIGLFILLIAFAYIRMLHVAEE
jgi:ABC-type sugar transport system permease subunit